jgi:hypothetical protein
MTMNNLFATADICQNLIEMGLDLDPGNTFGYYTPQTDGSFFLNLYQEEDPEFSEGLTDKDIPAALWSQAMNFLLPQIDGNADYRIILRKKDGNYILQKREYLTDFSNYSDGTNEDCLRKLIEIIKRK